MSEEKKRQMPKGGRKGGRQFPQISLKDAAEYAKKLVSKTHTAAQPEAILLKGVFDSSGPSGKVRASAMKQYGFMKGTAEGYEASDLAKQLVSAPSEEQHLLLQRALLKPDVFKTLFETFKGDRVSSAKIRQQAANHEVHPDNLEKCVGLFIESAAYAGVGQIEGDDIALSILGAEVSVDDAPARNGDENLPDDISPESENQVDKGNVPKTFKSTDNDENARDHTPSGRSVIHVNIDLDSSLDTDKLEKQLALLRRYGAI